ncbi:M16 family metallopeptidase [Tessaracoccus oleiagri]|uniref:Predicted Zn-dependent peptidase n=1 Tax=Tessaracoccus oleiagri TaxID=686624 RepID=A0A1G9L9V5_9ACTN|nr:pitrilysin family protein [Tessaracoccus oleiagri]SDL58606.1 Predicted Zn-dependent peptidase [Tessaracoccus oleiagri]
MQNFPLTTTELANGLKVAVAEAPSPGVAVNLWYGVGAVDEAPGKTGFAHLFEHLMFQGSANVASGEHMALIEAAGGTVNATTSSDRTNYFETVPRGALELALWLEADRMGSLAITPSNFEAQRQVVKEEKRERYDNQPYGDLLELIVAQHFPESHPYGHLPIGSMADLDAATLDDVAEFWSRWYRASNATLVLAGPVHAEEGFALAERYFGHLPLLPERPPRIHSPEPLRPPTTTTVTRNVPYSVAYLSWASTPAAADDLPALDLALSVLADGHASRLHRQLVKDDRVAQEAHAMMLTNHMAPSLATLTARPAEGVDTRRVAAGMQDVLARFLDEGPDEREFARAVAQYERGWLSQLSTAEERADLMNEAWLLHGDPGRVNTHLDEVLALTPADVHAAALRWLRPDDAHQLHYLAGDPA